MGTLFDLSLPPHSDDWLNEQQRAAVRHGEGPLVVVAGAGTGKTRVIVERIRHLLETNPELSPEGILALTYTRKAAGEMAGRVRAAVGERAKGIVCGTFHSFCFDLLQERDPTLQLIDEVDHWILLRRNLARLNLQIFRRLAEPGQFLSDFTKFFSRCQDEVVTPEEYQNFAAGLSRALEQDGSALDAGERANRAEEAARQQEIARAYRASDLLLRERKLLTFGALLLETYHQFRDDPAMLEKQRRRFRFVLVDEFQDTNIVQLRLLEQLAGRRGNIFVVGDDDQAIYRFRGASFGSFKLFDQWFVGGGRPGAAPREAEVILDRNYRSTQRILRVAEATIRQNGDENRYRPDKRLTTGNPAGEKINLAEFAGPGDEAIWVAGQIEELHRRGRPWSDFAVLYRAHAHRDYLLEELRRRGVPFVIRNLSILSSSLLRDVLAWLRLVDSQHDNVACARVLAAPAWGMKPEDLVRLAERAAKGKGMSLWDALRSAPEGKQRGAKVDALVEMIGKLRAQARRLPVSEIFDRLVAAAGLAPYPAGADGLCLERFAAFLREWEKKSETQRLAEFIEYFHYYEEAGGKLPLDEPEPGDAVQLMTVHAAKGLEFEHTFVIHLSRGKFPAKRRRPVLEFPTALMKEAMPSGDFHIQEERRLFYVAVTRARARLTLTTLVGKRLAPSEFLTDILSEPALKAADIQQSAPQVVAPPPGGALPNTQAGAQAGVPRDARLFNSGEVAGLMGSRIAGWAQTYRPPVFEPLQLSASAVDAYRTCPLKFLFQSRWGIRGGPRAATTFGNVVHTTIKHFIGALRKAARVTFEDVAAIFEREWSPAGFEDEYQQKNYREEGLAQLRTFHAASIAAPPDVLMQEKVFELPLDVSILVTGRMDQVNRREGGGVEIVDYKTGRPRNQKDADKSLQLSLYALAAREVLDLQPESLVFYNLATNEAVGTTRTPTQLDKARAEVIEVAQNIRAGHFPATPGFPCRTCEFRAICPAHEQDVPLVPAPSR